MQQKIRVATSLVRTFRRTILFSCTMHRVYDPGTFFEPIILSIFSARDIVSLYTVYTLKVSHARFLQIFFFSFNRATYYDKEINCLVAGEKIITLFTVLYGLLHGLHSILTYIWKTPSWIVYIRNCMSKRYWFNFITGEWCFRLSILQPIRFVNVRFFLSHSFLFSFFYRRCSC